MLAEILRDYFYKHKIIEKPKLTMVDAVDYQRFVDKWDDNIRKAKAASCSSTMCRSSCLTSIPIR